MFALRGFAVSLSVFVLAYTALSFTVASLWRRVWVRGHKFSARNNADLLFALRVSPLAAAALLTAAFAVPSYLLFEPRSVDEPIGGIPLTLATCALLLAIVGVIKAALSLARASRTIAGWEEHAIPLGSTTAVPVLRIARPVPALAAAGILRPRLLLSRTAEFILTENELSTALQHEIAHVRRRDNLKKLVLRLVEFPGMRPLQTAWIEDSEMAADDAAVFNAHQALDLAAALIKLSRLGPLEPAAELTASLMHSPAASVNARVERLVAWSEDRIVPAKRYSLWYGIVAALAVAAGFAATYSALLVRVHTATEWLVR